MADNNTMGLTMAVSGEKEFREALANINAALKVGTTELSLITAEYAKNNDSVEALTAKEAALQDQYNSQTEKVKLLQEQTNKYTAELGENDTKTLKWQAELNKAEAELANLNNTLGDNRKALAGAQAALTDEQAALSDGTKATEDYNSNIRKLTDSISLNESKTALLNATYGENAKSSEAMKAKSDLLRDSVSKQEQVVTELEKALEQTNKQYGTGSSEVSGYEKKLIDAKTSLAKMGNELQDNQKQINGSTDKTKGWNDVLDKLSDVTGVKIPDSLKEFTSGAGGMAIGVTAAFTTVIAIVAAAEKNMQEAADNVKNLAKSANEANISDQEMAALDYAAKITGVTTDSLIDAFSKVTELMGKASDGNEEAIGVFKRFGINIRDEVTGELKDADDVFFEITKKLGTIEDDTQRNALATELFGDQAKTLFGIFEDGGKLLKSSINEAWDTGIVKAQEYYDKLIEVSNAHTRFEAQQQSFAEKLAIWWSDLTRNVPTSMNLSSYSPSMSNIGNNANGTDFFPGGRTWAGENGPEIIELPRGTRINSNERSRAMTGGDTYIFNIDAKNIQEFNDLVRIAENKKMSVRMGYVGG